MPDHSSDDIRSRAHIDSLSAMTPRFNLLVRWFARRYFGHFELEHRAVEKLRDLERRGSLVYVMRYSSRLDYLLFNVLFLSHGLRLSLFANGIRFYYYRPLLQTLRVALFRKRGRPRAVEHSEEQNRVRRMVAGGDSFFLFVRTKRLSALWRSVWRMRQRQDELDLLQEVVSEVRCSGREAFVVPLSIFWRKGPRAENRFLNLAYGSVSRPSDIAKVSSFLATYRDLAVKLGDPIDLRAFASLHETQSPERLARTVRRTILIHLYREEKVVEGPTLRSTQRVLREVLADRGVRTAIEQRAAEKRRSLSRVEREAASMLREIAARMSSTLLAILAAAIGVILRRMFSSIETVGLDRVAAYARRHPLVLVPNHRSYFDFLIVSLLFYTNYLVPPHIAARENMGFGPFGLIFRMAGAFYLRRSFDDPLYKQVFRAYVAYLVREGFTQEFFIEGGRSRTGKTLAPRLGMLTWDVDAFLESSRRDLFFVPIAITYERLVEESGMVDELEGGEKVQESTWALLRARKYLQRRFGSVHVAFGEPISLNEALGERRERFARLVRGDVRRLQPVAASEQPARTEERLEVEKRDFVDTLGHRIVERINWAVVANATSVLSAVLLGESHRGILREHLVERARQFVAILDLQDVRLTPALRADANDFADSIAFMSRADLVHSLEDPRGEVIYFEESRRRALDIYRNSIVHYLAAPSILARRLLIGGSLSALREDLAVWQEILYREFFVPRGEILAAHCEGFLDHFERSGQVERSEDLLLATANGEVLLRALAAQTQGVIECYEVACRTLLHAQGEISRNDFIARALENFDHARLLGQAERGEAANETTFGNALDLMQRLDILSSRRESSGGRSAGIAYSQGGKWAELEPLRRRLAEARG